MVALLTLVVLTAFRIQPLTNNELAQEEVTFEIPENIQNILDQSCFGCHNIDASSDKAKKKLMLDQLHELSNAKLIGKLDGIAQTIEEGEMPPEKFLAKNPDKALTADQKETLINWANNKANQLLEGN